MLDKQRSRKLRKPLFKLEVFNHSLWLLVSYQNIGFSVYGLLLFAKEKRVADLFFGLCCFFIGVDIFFYHLLFFPHHPSLVNVSPVLTAIVFLPVPLYHLFLRADNVGLFRFGKTDYLHFAPFFLGTIWISADYLFGLSVFSPSHSAPILCGLLIFQAILYFLKSKSWIRNADSSAEQQYIGNSLSVNAFYLMLIFVVARNFISFSEGHHFSSFYILLLIVLNLIFVFNAFRNRAHTSNEQPESVTIAGGETTSKDKYTTSPIHDDIKKALIESLEKYFAEKLNDYDLAANNGNWQWVAGSGCDASPYFRVFNPEIQQKKFDPDESYIRHWIPEYGTKKYPEPMIEHRFAVDRALREYTKVLKGKRS